MMPDDLKTMPMEPLIVTMVGTGDGGAPMPQHTTAVTASDHLPNVVVQVVTPIMFILVRAAKAFVISLGGLLPAAGVSGVIPVRDFEELFVKCVSLSVGVGIVAGIAALGEVLTKLDQKFPNASV